MFIYLFRAFGQILYKKPPNDLLIRSYGATLSSGGNGNRSLAVSNGAPTLRFAKKGSLKL